MSKTKAEQASMFTKEELRFPKAKPDLHIDKRWRYRIFHNICGLEIGSVATLLAPLRAAAADFRNKYGDRVTPECLNCKESKTIHSGNVADGDFTARKYEVEA